MRNQYKEQFKRENELANEKARKFFTFDLDNLEEELTKPVKVVGKKSHRKMSMKSQINEYERLGYYKVAEQMRKFYEEKREYLSKKRYYRKFGTEYGYEEYIDKRKREVFEKHKEAKKKYSEANKLRHRYEQYIRVYGIPIQRGLSIEVLEVIYNNVKKRYLTGTVEVSVEGEDYFNVVDGEEVWY